MKNEPSSTGRITAVFLMIAAGFASPAVNGAAAQLSLGDAMRQADRAAYENRIARSRTAAETARSIAPLKGILPAVRLEAGYVRTTDPIGVFGSTLRQRSVSQANFDPSRLNYPDAFPNHQGAIVLEQPLLNADAWTGRHSASQAAAATRDLEEWTKLSTRVDVVRVYYGTALADERVNTLRAASKAAHAHVSQAEALVRQGLATKSDALLASVRAGDIDAQLADAEGAATNAKQSLAVLLGLGTKEMSSNTAPLPPANRIRALVGDDTLDVSPAERADVRAALKSSEAARSNASRARSLILPRVNAFARYDWNSADRPFAENRNWTVGVIATWSPFTNAADIADLREASAQNHGAIAQAEAAQANAHLELEQTRTALKVSLARLAIAERAVAQSAEAHRIVGRKYEGGLAQVVELLDAQAVETQSALALSQSRWMTIVAAAERLRALGKDPASLEALGTPGPSAMTESRSTPVENR